MNFILIIYHLCLLSIKKMWYICPCSCQCDKDCGRGGEDIPAFKFTFKNPSVSVFFETFIREEEYKNGYFYVTNSNYFTRPVHFDMVKCKGVIKLDDDIENHISFSLTLTTSVIKKIFSLPSTENRSSFNLYLDEVINEIIKNKNFTCIDLQACPFLEQLIQTFHD